MTYEEKLAHFRNDIAGRELNKWHYLPPLWWLVHLMGIKVLPPVFWSNGKLYATNAVVFSVVYWLPIFPRDGRPWWANILFALAMGLLMSGPLTWWQKRETPKNTFAPWENYPL
ncbi:MAG: DUF6404 family protein [Candidatus Kapabacteria bacterium]|nr:DUF6404 family protein [Candidatus Kapabacteria bacterium]